MGDENYNQDFSCPCLSFNKQQYRRLIFREAISASDIGGYDYTCGSWVGTKTGILIPYPQYPLYSAAIAQLNAVKVCEGREGSTTPADLAAMVPKGGRRGGTTSTDSARTPHTESFPFFSSHEIGKLMLLWQTPVLIFIWQSRAYAHLAIQSLKVKLWKIYNYIEILFTVHCFGLSLGRQLLVLVWKLHYSWHYSECCNLWWSGLLFPGSECFLCSQYQHLHQHCLL